MMDTVNDDDNYWNDELIERRNAELEFVSSAYNENEAWFDTNECNDDSKFSPKLGELRISKVYRKLVPTNSFHFLLILELSNKYPLEGCIHVVGRVVEKDDGGTSVKDSIRKNVIKAAYVALPNLLQQCNDLAESMESQEAIFSLFNLADEWMTDTWPQFKEKQHQQIKSASSTTSNKKILSSHQQVPTADRNCNENVITICRNLMFSHHIIGKQKRSDMLSLSKELQLTGFLKIGWPGIIIIEGTQQSCIAFYDTIRRWAWQYLVLRGEMVEEIIVSGTTRNDLTTMDDMIQSKRLFPKFDEVEDMSLVASHCRSVGLESLFLTSMKVYNRYDSNDDVPTGSDTYNKNSAPYIYGALVHVDHMNDSKGYRKWIRKVCNESGDTVFCVIQQCYPNFDYTSKRPTILVVLIGTNEESISIVLKKWRTTKVDIDSKGKPCFERMMSLLIQGTITPDFSHCETGNNALRLLLDDSTNDCIEAKVNTTKEKMMELLLLIGGQAWQEAVTGIL